MINLGFFRFLQKSQGQIVEEPDSDCRYTPYAMFVMETRLFPLIYDLLGEDVNIFVQSDFNKEKNRMDVYLKFGKFQSLDEQGEDEEKLIELSDENKKKIEKKLYEIQSENISYAVVDMKELYKLKNIKYPFAWFQSVLEYAFENAELYNAFIHPEGIYLTFDSYSDYKVEYFNVCENILSKIEDFHKEGVIVLDEKDEIVGNWKLEPSSDKRLYAPSWIDKRFTDNMVDFLLERMQGEKFISFNIGNNLVKRHGIISALQEEGYNPFIETSKLKIECDNLDKAIKIANLVDKGFATTYGRVSIFPVARMSEVYLYSEYCYKHEVGDYVAYFAEGQILFSVILKDENMDTDILRHNLKDYAVSRLTEVSKISKLKSLSPHDAIEGEYSSK
jgi:hypothetical protein